MSTIKRARMYKQEGDGGRSLKFAQEEIMNDPGEHSFIQRETAEAGLDVIQCRV